MPPTFADRLKAARADAGLSQYTLSDASGIPRTMIADYEQGRHEPGIDGLVALAKALETTTDALLGLDAGKAQKAAKGKEAGKAATLEQAQAAAQKAGKDYIEHRGKAYRLRRDGWEPV